MLKNVIVAVDRVVAVMSRCSLYLARLGGLMVLIVVAMIVLEIISRELFGRSLDASTEIAGYVTAISASWAFSYSMFEKAHIRIDVAYLLAPAKVRATLDVFALIMLVFFCLFVVGAAIDLAASSYTENANANTALQTPLWIPQWLWAAGMIWFGLSAAALLLRVVLAHVSHDSEAAARLAGAEALIPSDLVEQTGSAT